jgi:hypothetical protein
MTRAYMIVLFCQLFHQSFAQEIILPKDTSGLELRDRISKFYRMYPQEKAFLLTDNTVYVPGEIIWYKLFLWNEDAAATKLSNVAHIVLRNESGEAVIRQHIVIAKNEGHGDIALPDTLSIGFYSIEVFTDWMLNFSSSPVCVKFFWVGNGKQSISTYQGHGPIIRPEGGHITSDESLNRIAVASGAAGKGFTFELTDRYGHQVYHHRFNTPYAIAEVRLSVPGAYNAKVCPDNASSCYEEVLNTSLGTVIRLEENLNSRLIRVAFRNALNHKKRLVVSTESRLVDIVHLSPGLHSSPLELRTENYPEGIIHFIVINDENQIESHRALYHTHEHRLKDIITEEHITKVISGDKMEVGLVMPTAPNSHVTAFLVPENVQCDYYFFNRALNGGRTLNDIMLFQNFNLRDALMKFLNSGYLPITFSTNNSFKKPLDNIPSSKSAMYPVGFLLAGLYNAGNVDSIIAFKKNLDEIDATYNHNRPILQLESTTADNVYSPGDYPTLKTLAEFLKLAIPKLKFNDTHDLNQMSFLFSNLKGKKNLYPGKPVVILNGYVIHDLNTIKDLSLSEVATIEILYDPRTLAESNLRNVFPYGALAIYTSEASSVQTRSATQNRRLFFEPLSWPHVFYGKRLLPAAAGNRWPFFRSLYAWNPNLSFKNLKRLALGDVPALVPPKYVLLIFSLSQVKRESFTKITIE